MKTKENLLLTDFLTFSCFGLVLHFLFYKTVPGFERYTPMSDVRWQVVQLTHEMIKNDVMNGLNAIMKGPVLSNMSHTLSQ